jgi:hypothetical protein
VRVVGSNDDDAEWNAIKRDDMVARTTSLNIETAEMAAKLLVRTETSGLDGPTKLLVKNVVTDALTVLQTTLVKQNKRSNNTGVCERMNARRTARKRRRSEE